MNASLLKFKTMTNTTICKEFCSVQAKRLQRQWVLGNLMKM